MGLEVNDIPAPRANSATNPQESELYRQISREDEVVPVVKKKGKSPLMELVVAFMRAVLYLDSLKRTNELFFRRLNVVWGIFMGVLYISGILMIVFSIYNRLQLPYYLESQLKEREIQFESAHYDMDRIEVHQLKGPQGLYTVDTLIVNTTFTDLLQKRIRSVVLDGLNIYLDAQPDFNPIQDIPNVLTKLQHPARGAVNLRVNALTVNNAKLNFKKEQMALPITFSMEGVYDDTTQIIIPVYMERRSLSLKGRLSISEESGTPEWILKITKGNVTLPRRAPEDFTGEVKVTLNENKLETVQADFQLGTGTIKKEIRADFRQEGDKGLSGTFSWARNNLTEPALSSDLTIAVPYLEFSAKEPLHTRGTLTLDAKQFNLYNISFKNMHLPLDAELACKSWKQCDLNLLDEAEVVLPDFQFEYQRQKFKTDSALRFVMQPQNKLITMDADRPDFYVGFNLLLQELLFPAQNVESGEKLNIKSEKVSLKATWADESRIALATENLSYDSPTASFNQATLNMADLLQPTAQIKMQTPEMRLPNQPVLSQPFDLNFNMLGNQVMAQLRFQNQPIMAGVEGTLSIPQRAFSGKVRVLPFDLKDLTVPLHELWPNVPENVRNPQGKVAVGGLLNWNSGHASGSPLYVGLKDISFDLDDTKIEGVNGVLAVESLLPLSTQPKQHLFIQNIQGLIPIQGVDAYFQLDAQSLKVSQLLAWTGPVPLMLPPSVITTKNSSAMLYLKNTQSVNLKDAQKVFNLQGMSVADGTASLSVPVEVKEDSFSIPNVTLKIQDTELKWREKGRPAFLGQATGYFVRNGQIILDQERMLQMSLNGRLTPSKKAKEVHLSKVPLPDNFVNETAPRSVPSDILKWQNALFRIESQ